jgi:hypothetical protein
VSKSLSDWDRDRIRTFVAKRLAVYPPDQRKLMRYALARSAIVILRTADERARVRVET